MQCYYKADAQNRSVWLHSSNIDNTAFYNSHGFVTVSTYSLGDTNPDWQKPPVVGSIVSLKFYSYTVNLSFVSL